jgi:hypothetical protein
LIEPSVKVRQPIRIQAHLIQYRGV